MLEKKAKNKSKTRKSHFLASALLGTDALRLVKAFWGPNRLTVLAYHRIADPFAPDFPFYRPNVSTTPKMFAQQMAFVAANFNVISIHQLDAFINHDVPLPPSPLLITFDDGYLDTYTVAQPVLRAHNFPAVVFLITGRMIDPRPLWWDEVSYYFFHTKKRRAHLPLIGERDIGDPRSRSLASEAFIQAIKHIPEVWKLKAVENARHSLGVDPVPDNIKMFMSWDHARRLVTNGISCQGHTVTHPILSRVDAAEMLWQMKQSRLDIERETGECVSAFAYPNGTPMDYNRTAITAVSEAGYDIAFTYTQGVLPFAAIAACRLRIPRIHIDNRDTLEIFAMKLVGMRSIQAQYILKGV